VEPVRIRDEIELQVLTDLGDVEIAEAAGAAWQQAYEALCGVCGIPADIIELDQFGEEDW